ncbi:MAG: CBS domain-containing protein [Corynebacterium sp.]|nr:CBS domain-containing protein [Corynebacterium sp.]
MSTVSRFYAGRLAGMVVRGPDAEPIGRVRDLIVNVRAHEHQSRALGLVVELINKKRIFIPMLRIADMSAQEINLATGSVSMRAFQVRIGEVSVMNDIIGSKVQVDDPDVAALHNRAVEIADVEFERTRTRDWVINRMAIFGERKGLSRSRALFIVDWNHVHGINPGGVGNTDATAALISSFEDMHPADIARTMAELSPGHRQRVAEALDDERLADIIQELPEDSQAEVIESLNIERAADVLEEMDPHDAADLLGELPQNKADVLLELMDPDDADPVRRLMSFAEDTVGAIMTPEPIILTPQSTVAEALAIARNQDLPASISSMVFVVRPPASTPTGKYLGCIYLQRLLREPPSSLVGGILDPELPPLYADDDKETAARYFATYNLVCGPVLDENDHLLGAVAIDDLLDHMLPEGWREHGIRKNS